MLAVKGVLRLVPLLFFTTACVTVGPGSAAVVFGSGATVLSEGTHAVPLLSVAQVVDLRSQESNERLRAVTADGAAIEVGTSVVTWRLEGAGLPTLVREVGPDVYGVAIAPVVNTATRTVLGRLRLDELDSAHLVTAERTITASCADALRPLHVVVETVELRGVVPLAPTVRAAVEARAAAEQQVVGLPNQLALATEHAKQAVERARGVAAANEAIAATLNVATLRQLQARAFTELMNSKHTEVEVNAPAVLEAAP
jgi:regulator of protease activity HflC (stomatin/prohibitin superfamily)